jgi:predicted CopG family antitoxin
MSKMTNDDLKKKILKHRTEEDMRKALSDLIHQKYTLHVPPDSEDADMVLSDVIEELLEAREKLMEK